MPDRDELDNLIDSALARYAEPRAGLKQRILARVEAELSVPSRLFPRWNRWMLAGAAAMALVVLVSVTHFVPRGTSVRTAPATIPDHGPVLSAKNTVPEVQVQVPHLPQTVTSTQNAVLKPRTARAVANPDHPKLDVFPAPRPLSAQEKALVALATTPSDSGRESPVADQRKSDAPLQISAIQIPPINFPGEGNN
jgi:hypothetical protein